MAPSGFAFKAAALCGRKRQRYEVRIVEGPEILSDWLPCETLPGGRVRIAKEDHPIFGNKIYHRNHLEVRVAK